MPNRLLPVVLLVLAAAQVAPRVAAQGADGARRYLDVRAGLGYYGGERVGDFGNPIAEFRGASEPGFGVEFGRPFGPRLTAGAFYLPGRYPYILHTERRGRFDAIRSTESSDWIHMLGVLARWHPFAAGRVMPYLQGGATTAFALINGRLRAGVGPRLGGGVAVALRPGMELFFETDGVFIVPSDAMDLATAGASYDLFTFAGFGVRYRFGAPPPPPAPPRLVALHGAARLVPGEAGQYAAEVQPGDADEPGYYAWSFGDGGTAPTRFATHAYRLPGTYTVTFTARIGDAVLRDTFETVVAARTLPPRAVALLTAPLMPRALEPVRFEPTLEGTEPFTCVWDFGDGRTAMGCTPLHTYAAAGTYEVALEILNPAGRDRRTRSLDVRPNPCATPPALGAVYFERDDAELTLDARRALRANLDAGLECAGRRFEIVGYATPGERNPAALARARAEAVAVYYRNLGVSRERLDARGGGVHPDVDPSYAPWQYRTVTTLLADD